MAIQQPPVPLSISTQVELASRVILLTRDVVDNGNGSVSETFGCISYPKLIEYTVDANGNKTGIYDESDPQPVTIPLVQLMQLYEIQATLADGTVIYIGDLISNFTDQLIAAAYPNSGTITTPMINIANVLAAQAAAAAAKAAAPTS